MKQEKAENRVIKVFGEGKVSTHPDKAQIKLGVSTEDKSLETAQEKNAQAIDQIIQALMQLGMKEDQIQTVDFSVYPQHDFVDDQQVFRNFKITHLLQINVEPIEQTGLIIDTAMNNGANIVSNIAFTTSNEQQLYHQALAMAVIHAGQKAETIANTLKVQLVNEPLSVVETSTRQEGPFPIQMAEFAKSGPSTTIQPGTIEIISQVIVEFTFNDLYS